MPPIVKADSITAEESRNIYNEFKKLTKTMTERRARRKIAQSFHHDARTIYALIKDEEQFERTKLRDRIIREVTAGKDIDWNSMVPQALSLLFDGLYYARELSTTEKEMARFVLMKIDKPGKNGNKPKEEVEVY